MLTHLVFFLTYNRLLNTLTHALQSSGIDLSQANISVQINLGKRAVKRPTPGQSSSFKARHSYHTSYSPCTYFEDTSAKDSVSPILSIVAFAVSRKLHKVECLPLHA